MNKILSPAIAIAVGILVLLGYFFPAPLLVNLRRVLVQWAVILSGIAVFIGIFNLFIVHIGKLRSREKNRGYSLVLVLSLFLTFALGILLGTDHPILKGLFDGIILPAEKSLMALLAVTLLYAAVRLLRQRRDLMSIVFLATALILFLGSAPMPFFEIPMMRDVVRPMIVNFLAVGGARGILIGVGLGTLLTGLRILFGVDRPYGGK